MVGNEIMRDVVVRACLIIQEMTLDELFQTIFEMAQEEFVTFTGQKAQNVVVIVL